jgi:hypothetical protein
VHLAVGEDGLIAAFVPVVDPPHTDILQSKVCLDEALVSDVALPGRNPCGCTGFFELAVVADDVAERGVERVATLFAVFFHKITRR